MKTNKKICLLSLSMFFSYIMIFLLSCPGEIITTKPDGDKTIIVPIAYYDHSRITTRGGVHPIKGDVPPFYIPIGVQRDNMPPVCEGIDILPVFNLGPPCSKDKLYTTDEANPDCDYESDYDSYYATV